MFLPTKMAGNFRRGDSANRWLVLWPSSTLFVQYPILPSKDICTQIWSPILDHPFPEYNRRVQWIIWWFCAFCWPVQVSSYFFAVTEFWTFWWANGSQKFVFVSQEAVGFPRKIFKRKTTNYQPLKNHREKYLGILSYGINSLSFDEPFLTFSYLHTFSVNCSVLLVLSHCKFTQTFNFLLPVNIFRSPLPPTFQILPVQRRFYNLFFFAAATVPYADVLAQTVCTSIARTNGYVFAVRRKVSMTCKDICSDTALVGQDPSLEDLKWVWHLLGV